MFQLTKRIILSSLLVSSLSFAGGKTIVKDVETFNWAAEEACADKGFGSSCTIEFAGGSVSVGVCVEVQGPAGGYLTCKIDPASIPSCKNSAVAYPGTAALFASALMGLWFLRRRREA